MFTLSQPSLTVRDHHQRLLKDLFLLPNVVFVLALVFYFLYAVPLLFSLLLVNDLLFSDAPHNTSFNLNLANSRVCHGVRISFGVWFGYKKVLCSVVGWFMVIGWLVLLVSLPTVDSSLSTLSNPTLSLSLSLFVYITEVYI